MTAKDYAACIVVGLGLGAIGAMTVTALSGPSDDTRAIDRAAVLLIESDIDADTRRAGVEALAELLRVRRQG